LEHVSCWCDRFSSYRTMLCGWLGRMTVRWSVFLCWVWRKTSTACERVLFRCPVSWWRLRRSLWRPYRPLPPRPSNLHLLLCRARRRWSPGQAQPPSSPSLLSRLHCRHTPPRWQNRSCHRLPAQRLIKHSRKIARVTREYCLDVEKF